MKKLLMLFFITGSLLSQVRFDTIFELDYSQIPVNIRIENSGIYAISSFSLLGENIFFKDYNSEKVLEFKDNRLEKIFQTENNGDLYFESDQKVLSTNSDTKSISDYRSGKNYFGIDGKYYDKSSNLIDILVEPDKSLKIVDSGKNLFFSFNINSISFADLIGIDKLGNYFVYYEAIINHIPLKVERTIVSINNNGEEINKISVPIIKYLSINKEFLIDENGNLFHFISDLEKVKILRISNFNLKTNEVLSYPKKYDTYIHYNQFVRTEEVINNGNNLIDNPKAVVSRNYALKMAENYVGFKFICKTQNLAPGGVTAPDGDVVKTPAYLIKGWNAKVPYMWGGFSTLSDIYSGLTYSNKFAGDIHTTGVSSYSVGVDCSGFVSRCWQMSYHASTAYMPNITTQLTNWNLIKPGDAILKPGHVRLYVNRAQNGALRVAEASGRDWMVSYWSYSTADLSSYTPQQYNNMETDFIEFSIIMKSAIQKNDKIHLVWQSDTADLLGFRLYRSPNGKNWYLHSDETINKELETFIDIPTEPTFYRVSAVKNIAKGIVETYWSNSLGVSVKNNENKYLIIDGFNRNISSASYLGPNHSFSITYGLGLKSYNASFDNIKNTALDWTFTDINSYKGIFWFVGDESAGDESINSAEQEILKQYLDNGGSLFINGSEIGYDLEGNGNDEDKLFYTNYLKADYIADNAMSTLISTVQGSIFDSLSFKIGQTYSEDYPDAIEPIGGSTLCMQYSNLKGAGIQYEGQFGNPDKTGKLVYLSFPLETTADDTSFNKVIRNSLSFFESIETNVKENEGTPEDFTIYNNYPNPFNSTTNFSFSLNKNSDVKLTIFNILGEEIQILINEKLNSGKHSYKFENNSLSSGIYIANYQINNKIYTYKLCLIK